ncbi:hypothetical protein EYF80_032357 [Liparis tanakae]|uniref:DUF397 domain-containing protein n=1 Tax=Liparis tanakae TaxID=230148 RepID=A0A4Z2GVH8_9TELE|nr:hypothetical protein EYF80_032357 [Liparis tanakae]
MVTPVFDKLAFPSGEKARDVRCDGGAVKVVSYDEAFPAPTDGNDGITLSVDTFESLSDAVQRNAR